MGRKWKEDKKRLVQHAVLAKWEIRKLFEMPMIWIFLLVCIVFNVLLTVRNRYGADYAAYVRDAGKEAGNKLGAAFDRRVEKLPESDYKQILVEETKGAEDIFEDYDTKELLQIYLSKYHVTGWTADALEWKYKLQEQRVKELARQDASMDIAAAGMTEELFRFLFQTLCRAVIIEGVLAAVFMALYISGSEWMARTWPVVYAGRRGRNIIKEKFAAGAFSAVLAYAAIAGISSAVFAAVWQLGDIWKADMSTQFYFISSMGLKLPFISWRTFTLGGYFMATLALGGIVVFVFYGLGYFCGLVMKNSYAGFVVLSASAAFNFELIMLAGSQGLWGLYEAVLWSPAAFLWFQPLWFSDMGISAVVPWQECAVGLFCVVITVLLLTVGFRYFKQKDMK